MTATFVAAVLLAAVGQALAQPLSGSTASVEWMAAQSTLIVRGVIDDVSELKPTDRIRQYQLVSFRVVETLKGEHSDRLQFVQSGDFAFFRLHGARRQPTQPIVSTPTARAARTEQELLLFLEPWSTSHFFNRSAGGYAYTRFPLIVSRAVILKADDVQLAGSSLPLMSANQTTLGTPRQVIETIKTYLMRQVDEESPQAVTVMLPPHMRGGFIKVAFTYPADAVDAERPAVQVMDFATFKQRFGKAPPTDQKPPYLRTSSGYVGIDALELMAADCDSIVRGVVDDWCFIAATDDPTGPSCAVRLRVLETFKGRASGHMNLFVTDARDLEKLKQDQQEIVWFLRNRRLEEPASFLGYQTRSGLWDDSAVVLTARDAEVLFADLTWHREPDEILKRLREVAHRDTEAKLPVFSVHPPTSIAAGSSIRDNPFSLIYLPVDAELERNTQKWVSSTNKDLRWMAARGMIYFKSDKNADLLKPLLADDATWDRVEMLHLINPLDPADQPNKLVRWEAWQVLNGWGYEVPRPETKAQEGSSLNP